MKWKLVCAAVLAATLGTLLSAQAAFANHSITELVSTGPSGGNGAFDVADPFTISLDGSHAIFVTKEQLVPTDTDNQPDVYEHSNRTTTLVSTGPAGGNGPYPAFVSTQNRVSADGSHILFETRERLTSDDTDNNLDIYERSGGQTTLVSTGPAGGNGPSDNGDFLISRDGSRVTFVTRDRLTSDDSNNGNDVYQRANGVTTLISGNFDDRFFPTLDDSTRIIGCSDDGSRVFFVTHRHLVAEDRDLWPDIYEWANGTLRRDTPGAAVIEYFLMTNREATHVFFTSPFRLTSEDTGNAGDIYESTGGVTQLVSTGPSAANGNFQHSVGVEAVSSDGNRALFTTNEPLVPEDTNGKNDVYERVNGTTTVLISTTPAGAAIADHSYFIGASADGSIVYFQTGAALTSDDTDGQASIYRRASDGSISYVGVGSDTAHTLDRGFFAKGVSADGARVFGYSHDPLIGSDSDGECPSPPYTTQGCADFYEFYAGQTTLLSTGPVSTNGPFGVCELHSSENPFDTYESCPFAFSEDGTRVLFRTNERLTSADTDSSYDVYSSNVDPGPKRSDYKNASSFCRAEREFLGASEFERRYGTNKNGSNAFGKCVSSN
jgi:hypothetical protein